MQNNLGLEKSSKVKHSKTEGIDDISNEMLKKKKRPWRQSVRHRAKQQRLGIGTASQDTEIELNKKTNVLSKRQKFKNRKKKLLLSQKLDSKEESSNETTIQTHNDPKSRLEASHFRFLNERFYTLTSREAIKLFTEDPAAFKTYHNGYQLQMRKWPVNPIDIFIMDLANLPSSSIIADIGCGDAKIALELGDRYKVHSFDLVALNSRVVVADMAKLPLKSNSVDICIFCLSLMGTNIAEFIREAHRVLKMNGKMKIAEVASRFSDCKQFIFGIEKMGFTLNRKKELSQGYFLLFTFIKSGQIRNRRPLGLKLKACLYKKR